MPPVRTEDFPYTAKYVRELLKLDEHTLMAYVEALSITPNVDELTGSLVFNHHDIELLRKAIEMMRRGADLTTISQQLGIKKQAHPPQSAPAGAAVQRNGRAVSSRPQSGAVAQSATDAAGLSVIVETVSQAKETILKDLSKLLDDKLAGLDEVVVELIRTKSENDALKNKMKHLIEEKAELQQELNGFKPVQFGFYRKTR